MRKQVSITLYPDKTASSIPILTLDALGVRIGERREEGDYECKVVYEPTSILWDNLAEFLEMLTEAQSLRKECQPNRT